MGLDLREVVPKRENIWGIIRQLSKLEHRCGALSDTRLWVHYLDRLFGQAEHDVTYAPSPC
jgi:hypothetical protein